MVDVITEREINILEFDQIRHLLAEMTASPMGRSYAVGLIPGEDFQAAHEKLKETGEGKLLCAKNAFMPAKVEDVGPLLTRARKGAMLSGTELAAIMNFIKAVRQWQKFFKHEENTELYPLMAAQVSQFYTCADLLSALARSIDQDGNILDSASNALNSVRRKKQSLQGKIRDKLDEYIRSGHYRRYLQEALVTIRGGRYVLPVKQEYKQHLDGVVHDQSASGATIFIEPMPVVQLQNELTALNRQEEQEIERILLQLSTQAADAGDAMLGNIEIYGNLDFIVARGRLSLDMNAREPVLINAETPFFQLNDAVHPLLPGERVPLTVELGEQARTLVVTGPNTGGKTVALKTIGLLAVMAQCGLHLPADKDTKLSVFNKIRADIGDEQSIIQSLSTFSGHMRNIIAIIEEAGTGSLVLFDELGAGTDPSEGSALAMAILDDLTRKGALTVATTHINELKLFAQVQDNMQNAAMEFDLDTLEPTYRLLQGVPGQSNAIHVAGRLGLSVNVLNKAKSFLHRSHEQVEAVITRLMEDQQRYSRDSRQAARERSRAEQLMEELEEERRLLRARRDDIMREAREEARRLVKKTKSTADELIKELRSIKQDGTEQERARAEDIRRQINLMREEIEPEDEEPELEGLPEEELYVGREVYIHSLKQKGEIIALSPGEAQVQVGSLKVTLPVHELRKVEEKSGRKEAPADKMQSASYSVDKDPVVSTAVDLRGTTLDEAKPLVDKLIDNALWAGLNQVSLIHGKGTGKLKQGLRAYLKEHGLVRSYRSGAASEGGEGVTVVEIKT